MRWMISSAATIAIAAVAAACGGDASDGLTDSATTQSLLSKAQESTQSTGAPLLAQEAPSIDVATLGFNRGASDALVRVVEMSDFGCGFCRQFHQETFPALLEEFVESGMVEWKFMPFITGMFDNSIYATEAAECALAQSDDLFTVLGDRIWSDQSDWKRSNEPAAVVRGMASEAGVDMDEFDACLADDRRMERIAGSTALAQQLGVRGTPTFFVVGYPPLQGALPLEVFQEILNTVHAEASNESGG